MPTPTPPEEPQDVRMAVALLRQATEQQHGTIMDGQRRIEESVRGLRDEVSRTYVDKVEFGRLESKVTSADERLKTVDGRVGALNGYLGWLVKGVVSAIGAAAAALLFAHGGIHP